MALDVVKRGDGRRNGIRADWEGWMRKADELYLRFHDRLDGDSPFNYHEVASVGFLANAAAMAGYLPLNEYDVFKKGKQDRRFKVPGRADLWFDAGTRCYSLEFKRTRRPVTVGYLNQRLEAAFDDVECIYPDEYHYGAACLVTVAEEPSRVAACETFAQSRNVDFAYRIGPLQEPAFLFFRLKV